MLIPFRWLAGAVLLTATWQATATQPPVLRSYEAHYAVSFKGVNLGEAVHRLTQRPNGHYHFEAKTEPHLNFIPYRFIETSDFTYEHETIKPTRYFYDYHEGKRKKRGFVRFDWNTLSVKNPVGDPKWEAPLTAGTQDKLSYTLMLRHDLYHGKYQLAYQVAENDELKPYAFRILGTETVKTKLGTYKAVKVEHVHPKNRTTFWLAKELDYLLIKIQQERKGKRVGSAELTHYQPL